MLCMTVNPGWGGQPYIESSTAKVARLRELLGPDVPIEVDGGIDVATAGPTAAAGATLFVAGSSIFGSPDPASAYARSRQWPAPSSCQRANGFRERARTTLHTTPSRRTLADCASLARTTRQTTIAPGTLAACARLAAPAPDLSAGPGDNGADGRHRRIHRRPAAHTGCTWARWTDGRPRVPGDRAHERRRRRPRLCGGARAARRVVVCRNRALRVVAPAGQPDRGADGRRRLRVVRRRPERRERRCASHGRPGA